MLKKARPIEMNPLDGIAGFYAPQGEMNEAYEDC